MPHWRDFLDPTAPVGRYLPWKEVARRTSLSRTTAWRLQRRDEFPRSYPISPGRVGHLEAEVEAWIASRARPGAELDPPMVPAVGSGEETGRTASAQSTQAGNAPPSAPMPRPISAAGRPEPIRPRRPRTGPSESLQIRFNF